MNFHVLNNDLNNDTMEKNIPFFRGRYTKRYQRAMPIPSMTKAKTDTIMVIKYELSSALSRFVVAEEKDHIDHFHKWRHILLSLCIYVN